MKSMLDTKEGWMDQKGYGTRRFHYIRDTMALCGGLGFYAGDLVPDVGPGTPRGNEDCAKCFKILRGQQAARAKKGAR